MSYFRRLAVSPLTTDVTAKTSDYEILTTEDDQYWSNDGASGTVIFTLPDSADVNTPLGFQAKFIVKSAGNALQVSAQGSDVIGLSGQADQTSIYQTNVNFTCWLMLIDPGLWVVVRDFATWTNGAAP